MVTNTITDAKVNFKVTIHANLVQVPLCRQSTSYTCGPAALQSVLGFYCDEYQEDYLAKELHTKPVIGTDFREILHFCNQHNYSAYFFEELSVDFIKQCVDNNLPLILLIQAWSETATDYTNSWDNNHYVVACGYSDTSLFIMDPSTLGYYTYITYDELNKRWHLRDTYGDYKNSAILIKCTKTLSRLNNRFLKHLG